MLKATKQPRNRAFTLVELAISIAIIAVLLSGVTAVSSLAHSARIQKFIHDLTVIRAAMVDFENQYNYMPGDIPNAVSFFGAGNCPDHGSMSQLTCNGDGNGIIGSIYSADGGLAEHAYIYKHLTLANMYKGVFTPDDHGGTYYYSVNEKNTPAFNVDGLTGYYAFWGPASKDYRYDMNANAIVELAAGNTEKPYRPAMRGTTVYKIDLKIDDGQRSKGRMITSNGAEYESTCSYATKKRACKIHIRERR